MAAQPYANYTTWVPLQAQPQTFTYQPAAAVHVPEPPLAVSEVPQYRRKTFRQKWLGGLKLTLRLFVFATFLVLLVNIGWLIKAQRTYGIVDRFGTIQRGDCEQVKKSNTLLHLLINILSTIILLASAAFMQAYSSPTRQEIDKAHRSGSWLHVGLLSFRNMRWISKRKTLVCLLLVLTSPPFHLLYNSLVFTSLSANQYYMAVTTEGFLQGDHFNITSSGSAWVNPKTTGVMNNIAANVNNFTRMSPVECIDTYSNSFQGKYRHLVLVSLEKSKNNSVLLFWNDMYGGLDDRSHFWMCSEDPGGGVNVACNPSSIKADPSNWKVYNHPISYCLAEPVEESCSLQFSYDVMMVVIVFNSLKLLAMLFVLWRFEAENLLPSVGDAAMSFLRDEDRTTMGICLASKADIDRFLRRQRHAKAYQPYPGRWRRAASKKRWLIFLFLMSLALFIVFLLLAWGLSVLKGKAVDITPSGLWNLGFGSLDARALALVDSTGNAVSMAILANSPQVCLAILFICYNSLVTAMFSAADWAQFAFAKRPKKRQSERKMYNDGAVRGGYSEIEPDGQTLMVASPSGAQRSIWMLGAPGAWGVGLFILHVLLHWLVSQSLFMVQITQYDTEGNLDPAHHESNCGYSPIAIICALVTGVLLATSAVFLGLRKFKAGSPPVVGTCSAAISASCHPGTWDDRLVYEKLRWGEVGQGWNGVAHCSLASARGWDTGWVRPAQAGKPYA